MRIQEFVKVLLVESGILGFGIWNTAPINDWNPESKIQNPRLSWILLHRATLGVFFGCHILGKAVNALRWELTTWLIPPLPTDVRGDWLGWYIQIEQDEKCPPSPTPTPFTPCFLLEESTLWWDSNSVYIWAWRCGLALQMVKDALRSGSLRF